MYGCTDKDEALRDEANGESNGGVRKSSYIVDLL